MYRYINGVANTVGVSVASIIAVGGTDTPTTLLGTRISGILGIGRVVVNSGFIKRISNVRNVTLIRNKM